MSKFLMLELENLNVNLSMHPLLLRRTLYISFFIRLIRNEPEEVQMDSRHTRIVRNPETGFGYQHEPLAYILWIRNFVKPREAI